MKNNIGNPIGAQFVLSGGGDGGGWVTNMTGAADGYLVCRNDTTTSGIRGPSDTRWTNCVRYGDNVPFEEYVFKNPAAQVYDIDIAYNDSTRVVAAAHGYLRKSDNRCATSFPKVNTFKGGVFDPTFGIGADGGARIGGDHVRIDPANKDIWLVGHPVDGCYVTMDGGATTLTIPASLPAPINSGAERRGIHICYDRFSESAGKCQRVAVFITGRGTYVSTTGAQGPYTLIPDGPLYCSGIHYANNVIYLAGTTDGVNDGPLWMYKAAAWSQPATVFGTAFCGKPDDGNKVILGTGGGGMFYSTNAGTSWEENNNIPMRITATDVPWLSVTLSDFMALGGMWWDISSGKNDQLVSTGIGVFRYTNPPRTLANHNANLRYILETLGIKQMLFMNGVMTPDRLLMVGQDRPIWMFPRGQELIQASDHHPNYDIAIRHGGDVDWAPDDPDYVVGVQTSFEGLQISELGGIKNSWYASPVIPIREDELGDPILDEDDNPIPFVAGNVACTGRGKIIWMSTSGGDVRYTLDGGKSWDIPTYRHTEGGAPVDMYGAYWHHAYWLRRKCLSGDKFNLGRAVMFCVGDSVDPNSAKSVRQRGIWETLDHGQNWVRKRASFVEGLGPDFWQNKLRLLPGSSTGLMWVRGGINGYPEPPAAGGLFFSNDNGATMTAMPGWHEPEDLAFTQPINSNTYRIFVKGWRSGVYGIFVCDDFNPASPTAATWTFVVGMPEGRFDNDTALIGDLWESPGLYILTAGGGFYKLIYGDSTDEYKLVGV